MTLYNKMITDSITFGPFSTAVVEPRAGTLNSYVIQGNLTVHGSFTCRENNCEVEKLKERVKELEEKVEELSTLMDTLLYAPPNSGGCFYEEAKASFETIFEERKTK